MRETPPHLSGETIRVRAGRVPLVGRDRELALLREAVEGAVRGNPGIVFLAGEAGIGKTRLLDEAGKLVAARGGRVAVGRCLDERGMPPYLPWLAALGDLGLDEAVADPAAIVPGQAAASVSPEQQKLRFFAAVVRALETAARDRPLLVSFDDLQWSDESSNQLLRYVASNLGVSPVLIVGTYRVEEAAGNAELSRTIEELDRRRLATTVRVGPLPAAATAELLAGLVGAVDPAAAAAIHAHGEGNPFFVEEVVRALLDEGRLGDALPEALPLPRGVVAVIQRRLAGLGEACRAVLEIAALDGRDISVELIAPESGHDAEEVAALLEDAARAGLVRPSLSAGAPAPDADFVFVHDRIREAIASRINPVRRRAIHSRLGAALEAAGGPEDDLARLAALTHHFRQARLPDRAAIYAERLGDAAMRSHAHAEAARAYRLALESRASSTETDNAALLLKLGDAILAGGGDATETYAAAERAYLAAGDRPNAARALRRRGAAHGRREEHDLAIACLRAALRAWDEPTSPPSSDEDSIGALVELGAILGMSLGRYDEAIAAGRDALDRATRLGDRPALEAGARLALANSLMRSGDLASGRAHLEPALALALRAGNLDLAAEVAGALANHAYWTGDLDASERYARRRRELAVKAGDPYALRHARPWLANLALARGEWAAASALIAAAEDDVRRVDSPEPRAFLRQLAGLIALARGQPDEAVALLDEAIAGFRQSGPATLSWYLGCLVHARLAAGDADGAARVANETAEIVGGIPARALPRGPALAQLGIVAVRTGDRAAARRWYAELRPYAGQHHWVLMDRVLGMLAAFLGDQAAAERHFAEAAAIATRGGIRPEFALTFAERAVARRDGEPELRVAVARLRSLEMAGEADRFAARIDAAGPAPRQYPAGLSEREVAVLALLSQGLTNREIGDRLGIAEKTVTNHLTHIFTKADLDNRAAAVAFALRHGLAT